MGFLTTDINVLIAIGGAIVVLLVIDIIVGAHERKAVKEDMEYLYDEIDRIKEKPRVVEIPMSEAQRKVIEEKIEKWNREINTQEMRVEREKTVLDATAYQRLAMRTNDGKCTDRLLAFIEANPSLDVGGIINASYGLSGESGELNDYIKKAIFHGHALDGVKLEKEIGDCCWYIAMMCESFGFDLDVIFRMNIKKLEERYPEGFSEERSIHRKEGDV